MGVNMNKDYKCTDCGGDVQIESLPSSREWVCQNCGLVSEMEATIVEAQQPDGSSDGEVEEL